MVEADGFNAYLRKSLELRDKLKEADTLSKELMDIPLKVVPVEDRKQLTYSLISILWTSTEESRVPDGWVLSTPWGYLTGEGTFGNDKKVFPQFGLNERGEVRRAIINLARSLTGYIGEL